MSDTCKHCGEAVALEAAEQDLELCAYHYAEHIGHA